MKDYLLIIKGDLPEATSPEEMQQALQAYMTWAGQLGDNYVGGQRLEKTGALLAPSGGIMTDGPFLESKEMISGYMMVKANSLEEAIGMAKTSPLLVHCNIEVRQIKIMPE